MPAPRTMLLLLAAVSLILGILTGLLRMGWDIPLYSVGGHHGVMMLGGFLGSLICLERAVALGRKMALLVPFSSALSVLFFVLALPDVGYLFLIIASLGLIAIYIDIARLKKGSFVELQLIGGICWLAGNVLLYQTRFYPIVFPWWMAFIAFTIVAERLELTKFLPVSKTHKKLLVGLLMLLLLGFMLPFHGSGRYVAGIGLLSISVWLLKFDIAKLLLKKSGHYAFTGVALSLGYTWLLVSGILMLIGSDAAFAFDALIHTFFLGFTFSMVFAHGPIIFPGIFGKSVRPFHQVLWLWLALLHVSLVTRVMSDFMEWGLIRKWSGIINGLSIVFFMITMVVLLQKGEKLASENN